jgi:hypothetical protein
MNYLMKKYSDPCDNARILVEESKTQRWEQLAVWWFAASGVGVGIFVGALLALGLLRFWRPSTIEDFCGVIGCVLFALGIAMSFLCYKKAEWEKNDPSHMK